ncbi:MAG: hypothetical protein IKI04_03555 [Bacilli bacterium]|nr:hypothetical protein [Bacilli bacterium]
MKKTFNEEDILKLKKLAILIETNGKHRLLNRYDYYMLGGVPFKGGYPILHRLKHEGKLTAKEVYVITNYIDYQVSLGAARKKDFILSTHYQFGSRVLTMEEKLSIWAGLNEFGLEDKDIDDLVFSGAVRAYAKENGLIPNKKLVRKKEV